VRHIKNMIYESGGKYFVMVEMPSNEPQNIEHPTTFGYTEEAGPFDTLEEAERVENQVAESRREPPTGRVQRGKTMSKSISSQPVAAKKRPKKKLWTKQARKRGHK
jgi:hypothetical protein